MQCSYLETARDQRTYIYVIGRQIDRLIDRYIDKYQRGLMVVVNGLQELKGRPLGKKLFALL